MENNLKYQLENSIGRNKFSKNMKLKQFGNDDWETNENDLFQFDYVGDEMEIENDINNLNNNQMNELNEDFQNPNSHQEGLKIEHQNPNSSQLSHYRSPLAEPAIPQLFPQSDKTFLKPSFILFNASFKTSA